MKFENENFYINYGEEDKTYTTTLINALNENMIEILRFFQLPKLKKKKVIKIWNNLKEYADYLRPYVGEYQEWMVADTFDSSINILSYDLYKSSVTHKNCNMSDYRKIIIHEFVHSCQQEINPNANCVFWFWEALATNLSKQEYSLINIQYTKNELMYNYNQLKDAYAASYTIGRYLLDNYSNSHILEYVKNPQILIDEMDIILDESKIWVQSKYNTINKRN